MRGETLEWKKFDTNDADENIEKDSKIFSEKLDGCIMSEIPNDIPYIEATFDHTVEHRRKLQRQQESASIPLINRTRSHQRF